jgi:hypothetical protein
MADAYGYLTDSERVTYNETGRLMQLADWAGFDLEMDGWLEVTQQWIRDRRAYIAGIADGSIPHENGPGWDVAHRRERYDYLHKANYTNAAPRDVCQLPTEGGTDAEKVYISHREMWWMNPSSAYPEQSARRQACTDWLIERRKYVWNLAEGNVPGQPSGWEHADRRQRYANLQVATKYGSAYADWCESHNPNTGDPVGGSSGAGSSRSQALQWMAAHLDMYEIPDGSNDDDRDDGIQAAQDRCADGTWLRNQPWCGVWCWNALHAAGVKNLSSSMASVAWCEDQARAGRAPFTSWTTDGSQALPGDLVVMFGYGGHIGMLRETPTGSHALTVEGNTSNTSANRSRSRSSDIRGYCRVAYP